jgi:hypothetical protein
VLVDSEAFMCAAARPQILTVGGSHVDIEFDPGRSRTRLDATWLKRLMQREALYGDVAARWTDGANVRRELQSMPEDDAIASACIEAGELAVCWRHGARCVFPLAELQAEVLASDPADDVPQQGWNEQTFVPFEHDVVMNPSRPDRLAELLGAFLRLGIVFIAGVPRDENAIRHVADRLSTIDKTHLGDVFRLRVNADSSHIGETAASAASISTNTSWCCRRTSPKATTSR